MRFKTERLHVTPWQDAGAAQELRAVLTPKVLADLPPALQKASDAEVWITERLAECEVLSVRQADGDLVGLVLLARMGAVHLGYLLAESVWGQGMATEVVRGVVDALRTEAPIEIFAGVAEGHGASMRVLEKAGFTKEADGVTFHLRL